MFADRNVLKHLETEKILSLLASKSRSELGVSYALKLQPASDLDELQKRHRLFAEIENFRDSSGELPWNSGLAPVDGLLASALETGLLTGAELVKIRLLLKTALELRQTLLNSSTEYPSFELLAKYLRDFSEETEMLSVLD